MYKRQYQDWDANRRYVHTPHGECYNEVLRRALDTLGMILEREMCIRDRRIHFADKCNVLVKQLSTALCRNIFLEHVVDDV